MLPSAQKGVVWMLPGALILDLGSVQGVSSKDSSIVSSYSAMSVTLKFDFVQPKVNSEIVPYA